MRCGMTGTEEKNRENKENIPGNESRNQNGNERASGTRDGNNIGDSNSRKRMEELIRRLNEASRAYYAEGSEIMSNLAYDSLYDELLELESATGTVLSDSPTQKVGYEVLSELPKEQHPSPMLSLDKTKSVENLAAWLGEQQGLLSWKLDGLTIVLTYAGGVLQKAVTRGNGEIGEVVTQNARNFTGLPTRISFQGELVIRGEAIIGYSDFERINGEITDADARYKNPRNLCAGSVRQLDPAITRSRHVQLLVFALVSAAGEDGLPLEFNNSRQEQFAFLKGLGFSVVESRMVTRETLPEAVKWFSEAIVHNDFPSDGLVLTYEDIAYGLSLGRTAKFPRNSIAFKWSDEKAETVLREVEWSPSRTGLINPVAVFDPVELEGTTVSRASLHNLSYIQELKLGLGDRITVYKANMIIPQLAENLTESGPLTPADTCPACGNPTEIRRDNDASYLVCPNPDCPAKKIKNFALFVSRDALNIDGLSEMTLEKLIAQGFIHSYADLFRLDRHRQALAQMEGFGEKSSENLLAAVEKASHTRLYRVLYGLGIAGIGLANAKALCRYFGEDPERLRKAGPEELTEIEGIGAVLAENIAAYFRDPEKLAALEELLPCLELEKQQTDASAPRTLEGMSVVITGSLEHFASRKELQEEIEKAGGRAAGSVSARTAYLVNNDSSSTSGKNKKARELGIPVVTEEEFLKILKGTV